MANTRSTQTSMIDRLSGRSGWTYWVVIWLALFCAFGLIVLGTSKIHDHVMATTEAPALAYGEVAEIATLCPTVQPKIETALADGRLTQAEATEIASAFEDAAEARYKGVALQKNRIALGQAAGALPGKCDIRDEDGAVPLGEYMTHSI